MQEHCQSPADSLLLSICLSLYGVPFTSQLLQSAKNITPSWGTPKAASFYKDIRSMYHIITMLWVSQPCPNILCTPKNSPAPTSLTERLPSTKTISQQCLQSYQTRAKQSDKSVQLGQWFWNAVERPELWRLYRWKACNVLEKPALSGSLYFDYKKTITAADDCSRRTVMVYICWRRFTPKTKRRLQTAALPNAWI